MPNYPLLLFLSGFRFCDLLLSQGQYREVRQRAEQMIEWEKQGWMFLLDHALNRLSLGRALMLQAIEEQTCEVSKTSQVLELLNQAVAGLRESGNMDDLPRGLLARAALFRVTGDFERAWTDLSEAREIALRGDMQLWLVDYHLEAARLQLRIRNEE